MDGQTQETMATPVEQTPIDDWAAAFAALDKKDEEADESVSVGGDGGEVSDSEAADQGDGSAQAEGQDGPNIQGELGGPGDTGATNSPEDVRFNWNDIDDSEESITQYRQHFDNDIRERTIRDVAAAYVKQGVRNNNGMLGANINDPDIMQRDDDGLPHFYNPETGREFRGDNPRRQAQEWVDDYNRDLAEKFNKTCAEYEKRLREQNGGRLAVMEFAPKYKALDKVRQSMFDAVVEDYEITDSNGNVIGYSCDLNKALAAVNRQVSILQSRFKQAQKAEPTKQPSGPALDTPSTTGAPQGNARPQFKSLAEAMEWEQDQLLAKMKKGN